VRRSLLPWLHLRVERPLFGLAVWGEVLEVVQRAMTETYSNTDDGEGCFFTVELSHAP